MESQRDANKAPGELLWTVRDGGDRVFAFPITLKMKKLQWRSELSATAGTPRRNMLINRGSLEEPKPPATS